MIRGVELEDFMSYEHAQVPFKPGLNVIIGPNGAGKSSILQAVSLVLGQSHTERARRLTDLIRWGKDEARVAVSVDNSVNGRKLFPQVRDEVVRIERVLRRDGNYYYVLNEKPVAKQEISEALHRVGINPDNLMIVMHQLMVVRFAAVSPQEKLRMLEEAIGLLQYRQEVLEALSRLRKASEEEKALATVLAASQDTYAYWAREYARYQEKLALESRLQALEAESSWANVGRREAGVRRLEERLVKAREQIADCESRFERASEGQRTAERLLAKLREERKSLSELRITHARDEARLANDLAWAARLAEKGLEWGQAIAGEAGEKLTRVKRQLVEAETHLETVEGEVDGAVEAVMNHRVDAEVLAFKRGIILEEAQRLEDELKAEREDLDALVAEAGKLGPRAAPRKLGEIQAEINLVKQGLKPVAHLSDEVVRVYEQHQRSFEQVRSQSQQLRENREKLRADLDTRAARWREVLDGVLRELSGEYAKLLKEADGTGSARLVHGTDIERAGLEITAGFKGQEPIALDTMAQSGGERSVALMAFLLALQQRITSPFRAIDEFDVHLDPRNRDLITGMIVRTAERLRDAGVQYVAITPGPVAPPKGVHVIVVQNIGSESRVARLADG